MKMRRQIAAIAALCLALVGTASAEPALWAVEDDDSRVWLFGTIHFLPEGRDWRSSGFEEAFAEAETLFFETPSGPEAEQKATQLLIARGLNPPGVALRSLLNDGDRDRLDRVAAGLGLSPAALDAYRPWTAAITLGVQAITAAGGDPALGVDRMLETEALVRARRVRYLETAEEQVRIFADLPEADQIDFLSSSLRQIEEEPELFAGLFDIWFEGDPARLAEALVDSYADAAPAVAERLLTDRNRRWLETVEEMLARDEEAFFAVGAAHLVGDEGLVALLAERGYRARLLSRD